MPLGCRRAKTFRRPLAFGFFASEPDQVMRGHFLQQPVGALFIKTVERVRALDAVVIGARRSYVKGGALASNGFDHLSRVSLLREERRGNLICLAGLAYWFVRLL